MKNGIIEKGNGLENSCEMWMKIQIIVILTLIISSCKVRTIYRNYAHSPNQECDCVITEPLIQVGSSSVYKIKQKANCTRINYHQTTDSINGLKNKRRELKYGDSLYDEYDSLQKEIPKIDSLLAIGYNQWTHCKIKFIYKRRRIGLESGDTLVSSTEKIVFYNQHRLFRRKIKTEYYVNGQIVKTKN